MKKNSQKSAPKTSKSQVHALTSRLKKELFPIGIKYFSLAWITYLAAIVIIVYAGYFIYSLTKLETKSPETSKIEIDESYIKKLNTLEDFGIPASANEPGFGKEDPFGTL